MRRGSAIVAMFAIGCRWGFGENAPDADDDSPQSGAVTVTVEGHGFALVAGQPACADRCVYPGPITVDGLAGEAWELDAIVDDPGAITVRFRRAPITANVVFVTSVPAPRTGLADLDTFCSTRAAAAGLTGTFVAFVSTSTVDAVSRLGSVRGWVRMDGLPLLDTVADIPSRTRPRSVYFNENAVAAPAFVETGSTSNGTKSANTCSDWTGTTGNVAGGRANWAWDYNWGVSSGSCASNFSIYCFETDRSTPVSLVPPRAPLGRYVFTTATTWTTDAGIANADAKCQSEATAAALPGTYRAVLATSTQSAADHIGGTAGVWRRPDGIVVSFIGLDAALDAHVAVDATGALPNAGTNTAWFGALSLHDLGTATCVDWSDATSSPVINMLVMAMQPFSAAYPPGCSSAGLLVCAQLPP